MLFTYSITGALLLQLLYWICQEAYRIRLYAVAEFGRVIHEFDPYFNYRATEVSLHCVCCIFGMVVLWNCCLIHHFYTISI